MVRHQEWTSAGAVTSDRQSVFDAFDRVTSQKVTAGTSAPVDTRFTYLGLTEDVTLEEQLAAQELDRLGHVTSSGVLLGVELLGELEGIPVGDGGGRTRCARQSRHPRTR
jgi:hypothetical protein